MADMDSVKDYVGEVVSAICEDVSGKHVIARFDDTERVFCAPGECPAGIRKGDKFDIYIEGAAKNGGWMGSVEKIQSVKLWEKINACRQNESDIEVEVVASEENGLICDVFSLMGFMPKREIEESPMAVLDEYVGRKMKSRILKFSQADGNLIISHKAAIAEELRNKKEKLLAQLQPEQVYEGIVKQIVDFGAFVDIGAGVEGLVHRSNLSWGNEDPTSIVSVGQRLKVVVLSIEKGRIALGHKQLIEDSWAVNSDKIEIGAIVEGKVTTFANFGAFVRIDNGMEGLIHNSELSWDSSIRHAQQILKLNDVVRVRVIDLDKEKRRLRFSLRRVEGNPWQDVFDAFPAGTKMKCAIVGIADFGIFVDIGHGLRGLIHKNDLPSLKPDEVLNDVYKMGADIECVMKEVDVVRGRASLSVRKNDSDSFNSFVALKPVGRQFNAVIKRIVKFGAFAAIEDVEGLIHISEMSEKRIDKVESVVSVGQTVLVTVVSIDVNRHKIGLSLIAEPFEPVDDDVLEESDDLSETDEGKTTIGDIFPKALLNK